MDFEWDGAKSESNFRKHGVDFEEATKVFDDLRRVEWFDDRRDYREERYLALGESEGRVLLVAYTLRGETIRLIHARRANKRESEMYHGDRETQP